MKTLSRLPFILLIVTSSICSYGQSFDTLMTEVSDSLKNGNLGSQTESIINHAIEISEDNSDQQLKAILKKGGLYIKRYSFNDVITLIKPHLKNLSNDTLKAEYYELLGRSYSFLSMPDSAI